MLSRLRPVHRAALTSATFMAAGDVMCQTITARRSGGQATHAQFDPVRTLRFAFVGLTFHGPFVSNTRAVLAFGRSLCVAHRSHAPHLCPCPLEDMPAHPSTYCVLHHHLIPRAQFFKGFQILDDRFGTRADLRTVREDTYASRA
jgi:hypothetical protein